MERVPKAGSLLMSAQPFYITTAIDYVNGRPHLGHVYEKVTADVCLQRSLAPLTGVYGAQLEIGAQR